eukprot:396921_1
MSILSKWSKLEKEQKEGLFLLRDAKSQFTAIATVLGFQKDDMEDLQFLMKELISFAPFVMQQCYTENEDEKKEREHFKPFEYKTDFDTNGIVYWIGTQRGTKSQWVNPNDSKDIIVTSSSLNYGTLSKMIGREWSNVYTKNEKNSWMVIDFKGFEIKPNKYTLRHGSNSNCYVMNWKLEGMLKNKTKWEVIKIHENEDVLKCKERSYSWDLNTNEFYSKFRILQFGISGQNNNNLCISGFEIYGILKY